jgi:hypothetical protein
VEYSLEKKRKVGTGPERSGAGITSRYLRDLMKLTSITLGVAKPLPMPCPIIISMYMK